MGRHGNMAYLASEHSLERRSDPRQILPECRSIIMLGVRYPAPGLDGQAKGPGPNGRVAAYAWGDDYHLILPERMQALAHFVEEQVGAAVPNRWYTDTGPILERDLAQQAGLGWIGKNTCLINPHKGSYFLLAEILLGIELEPDTPFETDQCGTCTRCLEACPTQCIQPDRTIDARHCISYLTIELKDEIPSDLRSQMDNWVFGCDVCQEVCPWNRFAGPDNDSAFDPRPGTATPNLIQELSLSPEDFNRKFKHSPLKRAKRRGYLRNVTVALGNARGDQRAIPALERALSDPEPLVREHAAWALEQIQKEK
jgi:epoxyqueuosine reductase